MRPLLVLLLLAGCVWAQEQPKSPPAAETPPKAEAAPKLEAPPTADAALLRRQAMDWVPVDYPAFNQILEKAKAAGIEEMDTLLARLDASLLFADLETLKRLAPEVEKSQMEIAKRKGGNVSAREEVARSLKLAKQFLVMAEKRPSEVPRRAEIFRMFYYAEITLEHARLLDAAVDQYSIEKNLKEGAAVTWEQVQKYLQKDTQLSTTGATIFGDKFGPFATGAPILVPSATYEKLKGYLPAEAWGDHVPK